LMERMDFFRAMFTVDMQEKNQSTVQLDAGIIDFHAFNAILDLVYSFEAHLTFDILVPTLRAADFFCFDEMKTYVKRFIKKNFNTENIDSFNGIIDEFNFQDLEKDRQRYILSDPLLTPQELYVFDQCWRAGAGDNQMSVSKYDTQTDQWIELPPMPFRNRSFFAIEAVNNQIYICGADNYGGGNPFLVMFDTITQKCSQLSPMNHPRASFSMAASEGFLYVAGGTQNGNDDDEDDDGTAIVERYCIANDKWEDVSPMINNHRGGELVELNGFLYATGSGDDFFPDTPMEKYDPQTDRWEEVGATKYDSADSATVLDGRIYIVGIYGCEVYDPQANKWTKIPAPNNKVCGRRLSVVNGRLFSTGGEEYEDYDDSDEAPLGCIAKTEYFDFEKDKWILGKDMDYARAYHCAAVVPKGTSLIIPNQ